jgi:hypothetical protein
MPVAASPDPLAALPAIDAPYPALDAAGPGLEVTAEPLGELPGARPGGGPGTLPATPPGELPTGAGDPDGQEDRDWSVWWGTFAGQPGARIQVWRVQDNGLNAARPLLVLTVDDAQREGIARRAAFLDYLAQRFGAGRFRLSPRQTNGEKPRGAQSLTVFIPEESAMQVVMRPAQPTPPATASPADREALIEVERMRLVAEREREREEARERHRQEREERRREREEARERKRQEAAARAEAEERRRAERDERMQTTLLAMMKDVAAASGGRREPDPLTQALLAKVLERQESRTDMSEFIKTQAELGRLNAQTMMDQWRTMMQMSAETQARLISQAVETASQRESGGFWDAAGSAIAQALPVIVSRWSQPAPAAQAVPQAPAIRRIPVAARPAAAPVTAPPPAPPPAAPIPAPVPAAPHPASVALSLVRDIQSGARPDDDDSLDAVLDALTDPMADAIAAGDQAALFAAVEPAIQADQTLMAWLGAPGVGSWLDSYLTKLRAALVEVEEQPSQTIEAPAAPSVGSLAASAAPPQPGTTDSDPII